MSDIKIINPFIDIPFVEFDDNEANDDLTRVRSLQVGFGQNVLRIDRDGLWIGAENFADAPFSVDMDGNVIASSLVIGDYIPVGGALSDIGLGGITAGYLSVSSLSAISANIGTITSGTITGATVRTSSSGARVVMDDSTDSLRVYDATRERMRLDSDSLIFYDGAGDVTGTFGALFSNIIAVVFPSTELGFIVYSDSTAKFAVGNNEVVVYDDLEAGASGINIGSSSQPFEDLFVDDIRPTAQSSNPTSNGMMRYYVNGGTEGLRMQFGGSDFQFDATGV